MFTLAIIMIVKQVSLTEDIALKQAQQADSEIAQGRYRGSLHGIPYGIKDLFAYPDLPTRLVKKKE
ncbi:MAG: amidase family protein [Promethearchaeota archaeon]